MTYLEFDFIIQPLQPASEILIAELGELGFESFVENEKGLQAYILKEDFRSSQLEELYILKNEAFSISWTSKEVKQQNWNQAWEANFHPITVGNTCVVRAPFHESVEVDFEIVIEPKMSFGTGHHETTHMMLQQILDNDFKGKSVLDMGCGTGVLAILSELKGAACVDAIDIDEWCYENSIENVGRNNCTKIKVYQGDSSLLEGKTYDVIIANINRNILLQDIPIYAKSLNTGGELYLSGFYLEDLTVINSKCESFGLKFDKNYEKNRWVSSKYVN
ncbi:50S ribosomal protein L11 methyltransferase [Croceivirga thetidis]|uniref:Ribosomal protein L11 methyltransferase n=1 Tax=Croceivirga thetidis TaxID=2721623 RepID=A0ABX1GVM4_9FLAO|nr:50S ribosomal protein L11 methyltransferase [Croceivirga thetidis]NKI33066.1 50S ribosomal protein L11 methyltransferase [Croceivirga thetidis]